MTVKSGFLRRYLKDMRFRSIFVAAAGCRRALPRGLMLLDLREMP